MNQDILKIINTLALEILVSLTDMYRDDPVKSQVLQKLISDHSLQDQIEHSLEQKIEEIKSYYDFKIYKIASGQESYPSGGKVTAGFVTDKMNEIKPEEVNK